MILANGLGGTFPAWKLLVEEFRDRYRFFSWDYRGLFDSEAPEDSNAYTIADHAGDLESLMDLNGLESAVVAGWSMGTQVALEFAATRPDRVNGLLLFNGTYGSALDSMMGLPGIGSLMVPLNDLMSRYGFFMGPLLTSFARSPFFLPVIKATGFVDRHFNEEVFRELSKGYAGMDFRLYGRMMRRLHEHSIDDLIPEIEAPALFVHGEKDRMTPLRKAMDVYRKTADAEFFTVPSGSHYCLLEFPEIIHLRVEKFLESINERAR